MQVRPYLFFNGRCEEAAEFYRRALGAEGTMLMRWKDHPDPQPPGMVPPGSENKVMHMRFRIGDTEILASDGQCFGQPSFQGFALSLTAANEAEAERLFGALATAGRYGCNWPRHSSRRVSAWSPTGSACRGWSNLKPRLRRGD
jgi:PhnB protein